MRKFFALKFIGGKFRVVIMTVQGYKPIRYIFSFLIPLFFLPLDEIHKDRIFGCREIIE